MKNNSVMVSQELEANRPKRTNFRALGSCKNNESRNNTNLNIGSGDRSDREMIKSASVTIMPKSLKKTSRNLSLNNQSK
jgi:hypothetical protein